MRCSVFRKEKREEKSTLCRKVVILGDTCESSGMLEIGAGADLLVHEATYGDENAALAGVLGKGGVGETNRDEKAL